jgi:hypothetical protein
MAFYNRVETSRREKMEKPSDVYPILCADGVGSCTRATDREETWMLFSEK